MLRIASMWRLTQWMVPVTALGALALTSGGAVGQERGLVRPDPPVLREAVSGMPRGERQEIRVLTATLNGRHRFAAVAGLLVEPALHLAGKRYPDTGGLFLAIVPMVPSAETRRTLAPPGGS